jgi:prolyl 4-hydroxylase
MSDMATVGGAIVEVVSDARKADDFVPLFQRPEMVDPPKDGGKSIKAQVEALQATLMSAYHPEYPAGNDVVERRVAAECVVPREEEADRHLSSSRSLLSEDSTRSLLSVENEDSTVENFDETKRRPSLTNLPTFAAAEGKSKVKEPTKFAVGDKVKARFRGGKQFFRGEVIKVREGEYSPITYDIKYENQDYPRYPVGNEVERCVAAECVVPSKEEADRHLSSSRSLISEDSIHSLLSVENEDSTVEKIDETKRHPSLTNLPNFAAAEGKSKVKTPIAVGDKVKARFRGGKQFFRGNVVEVQRGGDCSPITYDIEYENRSGVTGAWVTSMRRLRDEISQIVREYKDAELPNLDELNTIFTAAMNLSNLKYLGAFGDMQHDGHGIKDTMRICKEINGQIKNKEDHKLNSATEIATMYEHALKVQPLFDELLCTCADAIHGTEPITCAVKKIFRVLEKMVLRKGQLQAAGIRDVVRGTIVCNDNKTVEGVLNWFRKENHEGGIVITNVKENYTECSKEGNTGAWVDVKIILMLREDPNGHKCEVQIAHKKMMEQRKNGGGHTAYSKNRSLGEVIGHMQEVEEGAGQIEELKGLVDVFLKANRFDVVAKLVRHSTAGMLEKVEGNEQTKAEIGNLDAQLAELMIQRNFVKCVEIQQQIYNLTERLDVKPLDEDAFLGTPVKMSSGGANFLAANYPSHPLSHYRNQSLERIRSFWRINDEYPGLQCISKDPFIFLVPNLLTTEQCLKLVARGANEYEPDFRKSTGERTSSDFRVPHGEFPDVQDIFSKVLSADVAQFETLKLIRYEEGQKFDPHHDAGASGTSQSRRITLFVYLNTPDAGGETHFTRYGVKIKPCAGLGVIHFPSRLSTASGSPSTYEEGAKVEVTERGKDGEEKSKRHGTVKRVAKRKGSSQLTPIPAAAVVPATEVLATKVPATEVPATEVPVTLSVIVELDDDGTIVAFEGAEDGALVAFEGQTCCLISSTCGLRDERVKHSGMPAVGEKYLATQWVHESSENANRFSAQKKEEQNKEDRLGQAKNAPFLPEDDDDF